MKHRSPFLIFAISLGLILLAGAQPAVAGPSKHTANYLRGHGDSLARKDVSLDVSWVQPARWKNTDEVSFFFAHTWDEREKLPGGVITIAVDTADAVAFVKKFKASPDVEQRGWVHDFNTRRLRGLLREGENRRLFVDMTSKGVDAHLVPAGNPFAEAVAEFFRRLVEKRAE